MSIVDNKKAFFDYFIEERFEAGIVLQGWEVKAIRAGRAQIKEAYVVIRSAELYLIGAHITPLISGLGTRQEAARQACHHQRAGVGDSKSPNRAGRSPISTKLVRTVPPLDSA
jgi:hypothetical protein